MIEKQNIRQILAILVTDIANYTETMNDNEEKAWQYLKMQRDIVPPMVTKMNGYMFKEMGDGTFSKFKSAIDAVQCALKIQEESIKNNLPVKIAVHLGDVMDDGVDVIGTGVNIASRINGLADSGNIVVSEDVWRQIRNQSNMEARSMGHKDIKGYHQTVEVFNLTYNPDGTISQTVKVTETVTVTDEDGQQVQAEAAKKDFLKKVAVFPFEYSGDEIYGHLGFGLPYGVCISMIQDPLVEIEYPSDFELSGWQFNNLLKDGGYPDGYNVPLPIKKKMAKELHCAFFAFGKVEYANGNFTVSCKVHSSDKGKLVSEVTKLGPNYFDLIDEISEQLRLDMGIPKSHIDDIESMSFQDMTSESVEAYDKYIQAIICRNSENDYETCISTLKDAVALDETFALANTSLFLTGYLSNNEEHLDSVKEAAKATIAHIYKIPTRLAFKAKQYNYQWIKNDFDKAEKVLLMWKRQYPESTSPHIELGMLYMNLSEYDKAIAVYNEILEINPDYHSAYKNIRWCHQWKGEWDKALEYAEKYMKHYPSMASSYAGIGHVYGKMGDYEQAKDYYEQALMLENDNSELMAAIGEYDLELGNFSEAKDQLDEALTFCRSDSEYENVYGTIADYHGKLGQIRQSIKNNNLRNEYKSKHSNPVDSTIQAMFFVQDYIVIGQKETALEIIEKVKSKLMHPFNHIVGLGKIFICNQYNEDIELLKEGMDDIDKFYEHKPHDQIKKFKLYGAAYKHLFMKKYDAAVDRFKDLEKALPQMADNCKRDMIICYNRKGDFDSAIKIGKGLLRENPFNTRYLLEVVRSYIGNGDDDKANEILTKLLGTWENADDDYIPYQEAKQMWKDLNSVKK